MSLLGTGFYQVSFIGLLKTPEIEYYESVASKYWGLDNIMGPKLFEIAMESFLSLLTCSRHQSLQIFEFQFSKSLFLFTEGEQENIFYQSKIFFGPMKNVFLSPFNK
jgi:hypothetical protein